MDNTQPGQVIAPGGHNDPTPAEPQQPSTGAPEPVRPPEQPAPEPTPQPSPAPEPIAPSNDGAFSPSPAGANMDQGTGWQYQGEIDAEQSEQPLPDDVSWTAAEFVEHQKNASWYGLIILVGAVLAAICYLTTKDFISTGAVLFAVLLFLIYAPHKPRTQEYHLNHDGLQIGNKMYAFEGFKTFSVAEEGEVTSIVFMPLRRFAPPLTIYVGRDVENKVLDYLSAFLPFEHRQSDAVDSLMKRIRF